MGFAGFSLLAAWAGLGAGGWFRRADAVVAMSPPLTLGLTGRLVAWSHRAPLVFNIQDVFPDAAVETGAITDRRIIAVASWLERVTYRLADAVTVLSDDLRANVTAKLPLAARRRVRTIPNFVDTEEIRPADRMTAHRAALGIGEEPVVLYAGNVGYSQSLELLVEVARRLPAVTVLINGDGSAREELERRAAGLPNIRFAGYVPEERLPSCWRPATCTPSRCAAGWARSASRPRPTRSSPPDDRSSPPSTPGPRCRACLPRPAPGSPSHLTIPTGSSRRVAALVGDPPRALEMGRRGRAWVLGAASPAAVAEAYERLVIELAPPR